jgi:hypothetical protein
MQRIWMGFLLVVLVVALLALPQHAAVPAARLPQDPGASGMDMSLPAEAVPAHHEQLPKGPLPATLDPQLFTAQIVQNAYTLAASIKKLLYQQPCYCHCDQSQGHGSLLDCYAGKHASVCNVCMAEGFYTYEQSHKGKTAAQIRSGIISGDWKSVDLAKYQQPLPAK